MLTGLLVFFSVIFLDILLSGDNAVVIGMAANTLPKSQRIRAIIFGMILAAITRIIFSLFAIQLLHYRLLSILGGLALLWVAFKLGWGILVKEKEEEKDPAAPRQGKDVWSTIGLIAVADISMSLDNILAVAGLARNNPLVLVLGLSISIAAVAYGSKIASDLLEKFHWLNWAGVGLITLVAIELVFGVKTV